jgi:hypothetical protein
MSQLGDSSDHPQPVIEPSGGGAASVDPTTRALHVRIRQQEILAELGVLALQAKPFIDLLNHTARLTAEGMEAEFCKDVHGREMRNEAIGDAVHCSFKSP